MRRLPDDEATRLTGQETARSLRPRDKRRRFFDPPPRPDTGAPPREDNPDGDHR